MTKSCFHVAIIGAGLGGLAAAIAISRAGHRVTVLEQAPQLGEIGAGIQIPPNSSIILKRWGFLGDVEAVSVRPRDFILRSYRDGKVLSKQNLVPFAEATYLSPYLHIHRADFHKILVEQAERLGVEIRLGCMVTGVDFGRSVVFVKGQPNFRADIMVGADGLKSACREALLGRPDPPRPTGDLAYRILVKAEDIKKNPELVDLIENPAINFWMGPDGHAVCYLLNDDVYNIVLLCPDNPPEMVNAAETDLKEMRDFFENWDPQLKKLLGLVHETTKWRLQNSEEMAQWSHPSGRFVLLGDACHATLPYLAQGAAQAVEDGAVLGSLLSRVTNESQLPDVLNMYEALRKSRTTRIVKGSTAMRDVFHLQDGPRQRERDRQLLEYQDEPFEGFPNRWRDPVFQSWLFRYDVEEEVKNAWNVYLKGKFPGTTGGWMTAVL